MHTSFSRKDARNFAISRNERKFTKPEGVSGGQAKIPEFYGENTLDVLNNPAIPNGARDEVRNAVKENRPLEGKTVELIAQIVTDWAINKGVTHFCHWFQPLTGATAEKHDAFLNLKDGAVIEKLTPSMLVQGEPDASSFPHGGTRSTFEARGYTSWDFTSPFFIMEGTNGKTLCIPTAFVSYYGDALDVKTPLLRSVTELSKNMTSFLNITGHSNVDEVTVTCGCEQEYFLVDKAFSYLRPDITMTGRTLLGNLPAKNQQLSDHYFGTIPARVESFMHELEHELYRLGIPAKTRHNEVAPGQFEIAPIFENANVATDHNQVLMALIKTIANKHSFKAILHEKPFAGVNGSGKHLNWSMSDNEGNNLLEPGKNPQDNYRFLAVLSIITEAVNRRGDLLRAAIASHSNDHRLGANEAPPSVMSVFLGDTLGKIFDLISEDSSENIDQLEGSMNLGASQLMNLFQDNTDRNRTSPFAFTGNKFEFRAVGSTANVGFPLTILNAAVSEVVAESNDFLKKEIDGGKSVQEAMSMLTTKWVKSSKNVVFNGDGYSEEWLEEAAKRGLPNLRTSADAIPCLNNKERIDFLINQKIFNEREMSAKYNVMLENYNTSREIEFETLDNLLGQYVVPAIVNYNEKLLANMRTAKDLSMKASLEESAYLSLTEFSTELLSQKKLFDQKISQLNKLDGEAKAKFIANEIQPLSEKLADISNHIEEIVPDNLWDLPKYYDMLFVR